MNKVITINLAGSAYQLEEAGYDALRAYLDHAARQLAANPDRDEILADIEGAVAEKCRALLSANRNVVVAAEIARIIAEMGPVTDSSAADTASASPGESSTGSSGTTHSASGKAAGFGSSSASGAGTSTNAQTGSTPNAPRRIYLVPEGAMIGGVCNGLAAYFGIDPMIVRALFVIFTFFTLGFTVLFYFGLMLALPTAHSPDEKAAAYGTASATTQEFIRRAREGYYRGMRTFNDKAAHREWKRKFRREMRGWRFQFHQNMAYGAPGWQAAGTPPVTPVPPPHPDWSLWLSAPFFAVLKTLLKLVAFLAVISLLATGKFFAHPLPHDVPVWLAIVVVIVVYQILALPFHAIRHAYRYSVGYSVPCVSPFASFVGSLFGLALLLASLWYCNRHIPEFHEFLHKIPPALHALIDALRGWWSGL